MYTQDDFEDNISPNWFFVGIVLVGLLVSAIILL